MNKNIEKYNKGRNINKTIIYFIMILLIFSNLSLESIAKNGNKGNDQNNNDNGFISLWNDAQLHNNFAEKVDIEIEQENGQCKLVARWKNGQAYKEKWYSLDGINTKYHVERNNGSNIDEFYITEGEAQKGLLFILIKEGNGNSIKGFTKQLSVALLSNLKFNDEYIDNKITMLQKSTKEVKFDFKINSSVNNLKFYLELDKGNGDFDLNTASLLSNSLKLIKVIDADSSEIVNASLSLIRNENVIEISVDSSLEPANYSIDIPIKVNNNSIEDSDEFNLNITKYKINGCEIDLKDSPIGITIKVVKLPNLL